MSVVEIRVPDIGEFDHVEVIEVLEVIDSCKGGF